MGNQAAKPYDIDAASPASGGNAWWTLHRGTSKAAPTKHVSIFVFDKKEHSSRPIRNELAQNAFKRCKTLRHPNVLRFIEGMEDEEKLYIVTEPVRPAIKFFEEIHSMEPIVQTNIKLWALHQLCECLAFFHSQGIIHGNICLDSIFVTEGGDFRIGSLDFVSDVSSVRDSLLAKGVDELPEKYKSPELVSKDWSAVAASKPHVVDAYQLGCCIWELWNETALRSFGDLRRPGRVPRSFVQAMQKLVHKSPGLRISAKTVQEIEDVASNTVVKTMAYLDELSIKNEKEKDCFLEFLTTEMDRFPACMQTHRILPILLQAIDINARSAHYLPPILKIGRHLSAEEFTEQILPALVKLFTCTDRKVRLSLLQTMDQLHSHLPADVVQKNIFPSVAMGFNDGDAKLRELTVKSMLYLVPKLTDTQINQQVLRAFWKTLSDNHAGIRTNTTICLGRIAEYIPEGTRKKVLLTAFSRSLQDAFPQARISGLMAFSATRKHYEPRDLATKVIHLLSQMDARSFESGILRVVREAALNTVNALVSSLREESHRLTAAAEAAKNPESVVSQPPDGSQAQETPVAGEAAPSSSKTANVKAAAGKLLNWGMGWASTKTVDTAAAVPESSAEQNVASSLETKPASPKVATSHVSEEEEESESDGEAESLRMSLSRAPRRGTGPRGAAAQRERPKRGLDVRGARTAKARLGATRVTNAAPAAREEEPVTQSPRKMSSRLLADAADDSWNNADDGGWDSPASPASEKPSRLVMAAQPLPAGDEDADDDAGAWGSDAEFEDAKDAGDDVWDELFEDLNQQTEKNLYISPHIAAALEDAELDGPSVMDSSADDAKASMLPSILDEIEEAERNQRNRPGLLKVRESSSSLDSAEVVPKPATENSPKPTPAARPTVVRKSTSSTSITSPRSTKSDSTAPSSPVAKDSGAVGDAAASPAPKKKKIVVKKVVKKIVRRKKSSTADSSSSVSAAVEVDKSSSAKDPLPSAGGV